MSSRTISAENLGPITELGFALESPGVTVLVAPNGSGKTILLEAVQSAARGDGKLPLRDRTKRGKVEAFGATITIGGTCRHTGEFEVTNLEGRFDLAGLVDPRIKTPALADAARIKSLVSLTSVTAAVDLFKQHEAFENFDRVVRAGSTATEDLVDMARKIKGDYDEAARTAEDEAERETGHADGLKPPAELDLKAPSDAKELQAAYDQARDAVTRLKHQAEDAERNRVNFERASKVLADISGEELRTERDELTEQMKAQAEETERNTESIYELKRQIEELLTRNRLLESAAVVSAAKVATIDRQIILIDEANATLASCKVDAPTPRDIDIANDDMMVAQRDVETGALIRQALKDQEKAASHRKAAGQSRIRAAKYRDAGRATDEVLSNCIKCPQLRVESDGKSARLVTDTDRGKSITYHDLSDGEKWTIAIDIGADQVGEGGLLVISQIGWEGIDGKNRQIIHQRAVERGVYILTAEAAADPEAGRQIVPTSFADMTAA